MKQTRYFRTLAESSAFSAGLAHADDGHIHSIEAKTCDPFDGFGFEVTWIDENKKAAELPEKHPPLTPQQYVAHKGGICPMCRGSDIEFRGVFRASHGQTSVLFQPAGCNNPDCEATWTDCYELSGYDNLER